MLQAAVVPGSPHERTDHDTMAAGLRGLAAATCQSRLVGTKFPAAVALNVAAAAEAQFLFAAVRPPASMFTPSVHLGDAETPILPGMSVTHRRAQAAAIMHALPSSTASGVIPDTASVLEWTRDPAAWGIAAGAGAGAGSAGAPASRALAPPVKYEKLPPGFGNAVSAAAGVMRGSSSPRMAPRGTRLGQCALRWIAALGSTAKELPVELALCVGAPHTHLPFSLTPRALLSAAITETVSRVYWEMASKGEFKKRVLAAPSVWRWVPAAGVDPNAFADGRAGGLDGPKPGSAEELAGVVAARSAVSRHGATRAAVAAAWNCAGAGIPTVVTPCSAEGGHPLFGVLGEQAATPTSVADAIVDASAATLNFMLGSTGPSVNFSMAELVALDAIGGDPFMAAFALDVVADFRLVSLAAAAIDVTVPPGRGVAAATPPMPGLGDAPFQLPPAAVTDVGGAVFRTTPALRWGNIATAALCPVNDVPADVVLTVYDATTASCHQLATPMGDRTGKAVWAVDLRVMQELGHGARPGEITAAGNRNASAPNPAVGTVAASVPGDYVDAVKLRVQKDPASFAASVLAYARGATCHRVDSLSDVTMSIAASGVGGRVPVDVADALDAVPTSARAAMDDYATKVLVFFESHGATGSVPQPMPYVAVVDPWTRVLPDGSGRPVGAARWQPSIAARALKPNDGGSDLLGKVADLYTFAPRAAADDDENVASTHNGTLLSVPSASAADAAAHVGVVFGAASMPVAVTTRGLDSVVQVVVCLNGRQWTVFGSTTGSSFCVSARASVVTACMWYPWVNLPLPVTWTSLPPALLEPVDAHAAAVGAPMPTARDHDTDVAAALDTALVLATAKKHAPVFCGSSIALPSWGALYNSLRAMDAPEVAPATNLLVAVLAAISRAFAVIATGPEAHGAVARAPSILDILTAPAGVVLDPRLAGDGADVALKSLVDGAADGLAMPAGLPPLGGEPVGALDALVFEPPVLLSVRAIQRTMAAIDGGVLRVLFDGHPLTPAAVDGHTYLELPDNLSAAGANLRPDVAMATGCDDALRAWDALCDLGDAVSVDAAWGALEALEPNPHWALLPADAFEACDLALARDGDERERFAANMLLSLHRSTAAAVLAHVRVEKSAAAARGTARWDITTTTNAETRTRGVFLVSVVFVAAFGGAPYGTKGGRTIVRAPCRPVVATDALVDTLHTATDGAAADALQDVSGAQPDTWMRDVLASPACVRVGVEAMGGFGDTRWTTPRCVVDAQRRGVRASLGATPRGWRDGVAVQAVIVAASKSPGRVRGAVDAGDVWEQGQDPAVPVQPPGALPTAAAVYTDGVVDMAGGPAAPGAPTPDPRNPALEAAAPEVVVVDLEDHACATVTFAAQTQRVVDVPLCTQAAIRTLGELLPGVKGDMATLAKLSRALRQLTTKGVSPVLYAPGVGGGGRERRHRRSRGGVHPGRRRRLRRGRRRTAREGGGGVCGGRVCRRNQGVGEGVRQGRRCRAARRRGARERGPAGRVGARKRRRPVPAGGERHPVGAATGPARWRTTEGPGGFQGSGRGGGAHPRRPGRAGLPPHAALQRVGADQVMRHMLFNPTILAESRELDIAIPRNVAHVDDLAVVVANVRPEVWSLILGVDRAHAPSTRRAFVVDRITRGLQANVDDAKVDLDVSEGVARDVLKALEAARHLGAMQDERFPRADLWTLIGDHVPDTEPVRREIETLGTVDDALEWLLVYAGSTAPPCPGGSDVVDPGRAHLALASFGAAVLLVDFLARVALEPQTVKAAVDDRGDGGGRAFRPGPDGLEWNEFEGADDGTEAMATFDASRFASGLRADADAWASASPQLEFMPLEDVAGGFAVPGVPAEVMAATRAAFGAVVPPMDVVQGGHEEDEEEAGEDGGDDDGMFLDDMQAVQTKTMDLGQTKLENHGDFVSGQEAWEAALRGACDAMDGAPDVDVAPGPFDPVQTLAAVAALLPGRKFQVLEQAVAGLDLAARLQEEVDAARKTRLNQNLRTLETLEHVHAVLAWPGWAGHLAGPPHEMPASFKTTGAYAKELATAALEARRRAREEDGGDDPVTKDMVREEALLRARHNTGVAKDATAFLVRLAALVEAANAAQQGMADFIAIVGSPAQKAAAAAAATPLPGSVDGVAFAPGLPAAGLFWAWFVGAMGTPRELMAAPKKGWVVFMAGVSAGFNETAGAQAAMNATVASGTRQSESAVDRVLAASDDAAVSFGKLNFRGAVSVAMAGLRGDALFDAMNFPLGAARQYAGEHAERCVGRRRRRMVVAEDDEPADVVPMARARGNASIALIQATKAAASTVAAVAAMVDDAALGDAVARRPDVAAVLKSEEFVKVVWTKLWKEEGNPHCDMVDAAWNATDPVAMVRNWITRRHRNPPGSPMQEAAALWGAAGMVDIFMRTAPGQAFDAATEKHTVNVRDVVAADVAREVADSMASTAAGAALGPETVDAMKQITGLPWLPFDCVGGPGAALAAALSEVCTAVKQRAAAREGERKKRDKRPISSAALAQAHAALDDGLRFDPRRFLGAFVHHAATIAAAVQLAEKAKRPPALSAEDRAVVKMVRELAALVWTTYVEFSGGEDADDMDGAARDVGKAAGTPSLAVAMDVVARVVTGRGFSRAPGPLRDSIVALAADLAAGVAAVAGNQPATRRTDQWCVQFQAVADTPIAIVDGTRAVAETVVDFGWAVGRQTVAAVDAEVQRTEDEGVHIKMVAMLRNTLRPALTGALVAFSSRKKGCVPEVSGGALPPAASQKALFRMQVAVEDAYHVSSFGVRSARPTPFVLRAHATRVCSAYLAMQKRLLSGMAVFETTDEDAGMAANLDPTHLDAVADKWRPVAQELAASLGVPPVPIPVVALSRAADKFLATHGLTSASVVVPPGDGAPAPEGSLLHIRVADLVSAAIRKSGAKPSARTAATGTARFVVWAPGTVDVSLSSPPGAPTVGVAVGNPVAPYTEGGGEGPGAGVTASLDGAVVASWRGTVTWSPHGPQLLENTHCPSQAVEVRFPNVVSTPAPRAKQLLRDGKAPGEAVGVEWVVLDYRADAHEKRDRRLLAAPHPCSMQGPRVEVHSPSASRLSPSAPANVACLALDSDAAAPGNVVSRRVWGANPAFRDHLGWMTRDVATAMGLLAAHVVLVRKRIALGPLTNGTPDVYFLAAVEGHPVAVARDAGHVVIFVGKLLAFAVWGGRFAVRLARAAKGPKRRGAEWTAAGPMTATDWDSHPALRAVWTSRRMRAVLQAVRGATSSTHTRAAAVWFERGLPLTRPRPVYLPPENADVVWGITRAIVNGAVGNAEMALLAAAVGLDAVRTAATAAAAAHPGNVAVQQTADAVLGNDRDDAATYHAGGNLAAVLVALETGWWFHAAPAAAAAVGQARRAVLAGYTDETDESAAIREIKAPWVDAMRHLNAVAPHGGVPAAVLAEKELVSSVRRSWAMADRTPAARTALRRHLRRVVPACRSMLGEAFDDATNRVAFLGGTSCMPGTLPTARIAVFPVDDGDDEAAAALTDDDANGFVGRGKKATQLTTAARSARRMLLAGGGRIPPDRYTATPVGASSVDSNSDFDLDANRGTWRTPAPGDLPDAPAIPTNTKILAASDVVDIVLHDGTPVPHDGMPVHPDAIGRWATYKSEKHSAPVVVTLLSPPMVLDTGREMVVHVLAPRGTPGVQPIAGWPTVDGDPLAASIAASDAFVDNWLRGVSNWAPARIGPPAAGAGAGAAPPPPPAKNGKRRHMSVYGAPTPKPATKKAPGKGEAQAQAPKKAAVESWVVCRVPAAKVDLPAQHGGDDSGSDDSGGEGGPPRGPWVVALPERFGAGETFANVPLLPNTAALHREAAAGEGRTRLVDVALAAPLATPFGVGVGRGWCVRMMGSDQHQSQHLFGVVEDVVVDCQVASDGSNGVYGDASLLIRRFTGPTRATGGVVDKHSISGLLGACPPGPLGVVMTQRGVPATVGACFVKTHPRHVDVLVPATVEANAGAALALRHNMPWTPAPEALETSSVAVSVYAADPLAMVLAGSAVAGAAFPVATEGGPVLGIRPVATAFAKDTRAPDKRDVPTWDGAAIHAVFQATMASAARRMLMDRIFFRARALKVRPHPAIAQYAYAVLGARRQWGLRLMVAGIAAETSWDAHAAYRGDAAFAGDGATAAAGAGVPLIANLKRVLEAGRDARRADKRASLQAMAAVATAALQFATGCVSTPDATPTGGLKFTTGPRWEATDNYGWGDAFVDWVSTTFAAVGVEAAEDERGRACLKPVGNPRGLLALALAVLIPKDQARGVRDCADRYNKSPAAHRQMFTSPFTFAMGTAVGVVTSRKWIWTQVVSRLLRDPRSAQPHDRFEHRPTLTQYLSPACAAVVKAAAALAHAVSCVTEARPAAAGTPFRGLYTAVTAALASTGVLKADAHDVDVADALDACLQRCLYRGEDDATRTVADRLPYMRHARGVTNVAPSATAQFTGSEPMASVCGEWPPNPATSKYGRTPFDFFPSDVTSKREKRPKNYGLVSVTSHTWPSAWAAKSGAVVKAGIDASRAARGEPPIDDTVMRHVWVVPALEVWASTSKDHEEAPIKTALVDAGVGAWACNRTASLTLHPPGKATLDALRRLKDASAGTDAVGFSDFIGGDTFSEKVRGYRVASSAWLRDPAARAAEGARWAIDRLEVGIAAKAHVGRFAQVTGGSIDMDGAWEAPARGTVGPFSDFVPALQLGTIEAADAPRVRTPVDGPAQPMGVSPGGMVLAAALHAVPDSKQRMGVYLKAFLPDRMDDMSMEAALRYRCSVIDVDGAVSLDTVVAATVHPSVSWERDIVWPDPIASADDDGEFSASGDGDGGEGYEDDEDDGDDGEDGDDDDYEHAGAEETKASDDEEDNTFG